MDVTRYYEVCEATWPAARLWQSGKWTLRDGQGGGKRVSAATQNAANVSAEDVAQAEAEMLAMGQDRLFMLREGEEALDALLEGLGYRIIDPVNIYHCPVKRLSVIPRPRVSGFPIWEPMEIMKEIWRDGGIGAGRIDVMRRARGPKTTILGRANDRAAASAFVAIDQGVAMLHALEVAGPQRRQGVARTTMSHAAFWAEENGAQTFSVIVTQQNTAANALYRGLGMEIAGQYHYRIR